ncbi:MAG TPA: hypothetical protein H9852_00400 [Candidatus Mediterraneibacter colneyensis]|nr:hypothetical protein [Candidatus Mediterraneibacter colneyensis]
MYNTEKLSLKAFQDNKSFGSIEDSETILHLTEQMLKMPFGKVFHPKIRSVGVDPCAELDMWYHDDGLLTARCSPLDEAADFGDMLALLQKYMDLTGKKVVKSYTDIVLMVYCSFYRGFIPDGS